jgi:hypothetical protein
MGTSRNESSPNIPPWRPVQGLLGRTGVEPDRQNLEIWRAAVADRDSRLPDELGSQIISRTCALATSADSVPEVLSQFDSLVDEARASGIYVEVAKRALVRTRAESGTATQFAQELFAESALYYTSRDLPSVVGAQSRIGTAREAIGLKTTIANLTRGIVAAAGEPNFGTDEEWRQYVATVVDSLMSEGLT